MGDESVRNVALPQDMLAYLQLTFSGSSDLAEPVAIRPTSETV